MSKYFKSTSLIDSSVVNKHAADGTVTTNAQLEHVIRRTSNGYTDSDLELFSALMDYRQSGSFDNRTVVRSLASAQTHYTQQDTDHFDYLTTVIASSNSTVNISESSDVALSDDQIKIQYFDNT